MDGQFNEKYLRKCHKRLRELGAPLENWNCREVVDGETADFICELCSCQKVRYIHVMEHPEYNGELNVGCICAGYMEGDLIAARERDDAARRKSSRRANFRNVVIEREVFRGRDFYKIQIDTDCYQWWKNRRIETLEDAKLVVFELIDWEETQ